MLERHPVRAHRVALLVCLLLGGLGALAWGQQPPPLQQQLEVARGTLDVCRDVRNMLEAGMGSLSVDNKALRQQVQQQAEELMKLKAAALPPTATSAPGALAAPYEEKENK